MATDDRSLDALRRAYEELARRGVQERLVFADRVQEVLDASDQLHAAIRRANEDIARLSEDNEALRARIDSLHAELIEAHRNAKALEQSRSFRYTSPLRRLSRALGRR